MTIKGDSDSDSDSDVLTIPLDLAGCMVHFKHRLPTAEEIASFKQYCLTQGDVPWNLSSFSDQMADKFYQQVIETENSNICLGFTSKDPPVTVVDKVSQHNHQKMPFYDPADLQMNNVNGEPAHIVFHADSVQKTNVEESVLLNIDPHFSQALHSKIDYESLSPYFAFKPHDVIQQTLSQTKQLAKSTIHYPMQCQLRSQFQVLRSLGVDLDTPTLMLGDNMSIVLYTSVPSSVLKKKHNAIAYH
jgi:hypothetical protein